MTVVVPCDALEAAKATKAIADIDGPVYLRLGREKVPTITTKETPFKIGKINILRESPKAEVTIFACGYQVYIALLAAKKLAEDGIEVNVINNHTIKPLDEKGILAEVKKTGAVVTVEDHQIAGGMGSAIAEFLTQNYPVPMEFIGVLDKFGQSGPYHVLYEHYGISVPAIMDAVQMVLARKVDKHHK
jgi:transketolase